MKQFKKIAIIGVGLIGGSIAAAVRVNKVAAEVVGVVRSDKTLRRVARAKVADSVTRSISDGVKEAELVIVCTPVRSIPPTVRILADLMSPGAVITDVGSTKEWVVDASVKAACANPAIHFIGAHPMAGSERTGVEASRADLFDGARCIVTRTAHTNGRALRTVSSFWRALGAKVSCMTPRQHDAVISAVSHAPHFVSFALSAATPDDVLCYAADGYRDTTRIAASDPQLWADILLTNRGELLSTMGRVMRAQTALAQAIRRNDRARVVRILQTAQKKRLQLQGDDA